MASPTLLFPTVLGIYRAILVHIPFLRERKKKEKNKSRAQITAFQGGTWLPSCVWATPQPAGSSGNMGWGAEEGLERRCWGPQAVFTCRDPGSARWSKVGVKFFSSQGLQLQAPLWQEEAANPEWARPFPRPLHPSRGPSGSSDLVFLPRGLGDLLVHLSLVSRPGPLSASRRVTMGQPQPSVLGWLFFFLSFFVFLFFFLKKKAKSLLGGGWELARSFHF